MHSCCESPTSPVTALNHLTHSKRAESRTPPFAIFRSQHRILEPTTQEFTHRGIANMRTYEDTFSGDKIYPGKVSSLLFCDRTKSFTIPSSCLQPSTRSEPGMINLNADRMLIVIFGVSRVSSMFVVTARSSGSKTGRPNPSSYSARTQGELHGRCFSEGNTKRVSLRLVRTHMLYG